ncbi:hypothetical protein OF377_02070 [Ureaplasma sp. ES3154-GEN]|uniref:hypothetical protein n=1 Tax=Ureaplasma sp. ES3154-GEN TaxID=2984844 RepID=UPI0021E79EDF|nr:hypothetical protein [Ureaplasma sp. ES3154-GEN]MCV3743656.1 hypothetical protein [Ureaplasma sp. ES3154-GEN]
MTNENKINNDFLASKIKQFDEHITEINNAYEFLVTGLKNFKDFNKSLVSSRTKSINDDAILKLADLYFVQEGLKDFCSDAIASDANQTWLKDSARFFLINHFGDVEKPENFFNLLEKEHTFNNHLETASLFLIYNLEKEYEWYNSLGYEDYEGIELDFLFIRQLRPKISVFFMETKTIIQNISLLKIGRLLSLLDEPTYNDYLKKNIVYLQQHFNSNYEFFKNYVMAICFDGLNINNPQKISTITHNLLQLLNRIYDSKK